MVCSPLSELEEVEALSEEKVAAIVSAGKPAAATMAALSIRNARRDVTTLVIVLLMESPSTLVEILAFNRQANCGGHFLNQAFVRRNDLARCDD
jgi:hypothetical protein